MRTEAEITERHLQAREVEDCRQQQALGGRRGPPSPCPRLTCPALPTPNLDFQSAELDGIAFLLPEAAQRGNLFQPP